MFPIKLITKNTIITSNQTVLYSSKWALEDNLKKISNDLNKYYNYFLTQKINGLLNQGIDVEVMVVGVSAKRDIGVPVYYQPILAAKGLSRWLHSLLLIFKSVLSFVISIEPFL